MIYANFGFLVSVWGFEGWSCSNFLASTARSGMGPIPSCNHTWRLMGLSNYFELGL